MKILQSVHDDKTLYTSFVANELTITGISSLISSCLVIAGLINCNKMIVI